MYAQLAELDAFVSGGYNVPLAANPFDSWATVIDCGDVPVTSYDPKWAIHQIEEGHNSILMRDPATHADEPGLAKKDKTFPRVITMGGDHSITLPLLSPVIFFNVIILNILAGRSSSATGCFRHPILLFCPWLYANYNNRDCGCNVHLRRYSNAHFYLFFNCQWN